MIPSTFEKNNCKQVILHGLIIYFHIFCKGLIKILKFHQSGCLCYTYVWYNCFLGVNSSLLLDTVNLLITAIDVYLPIVKELASLEYWSQIFYRNQYLNYNLDITTESCLSCIAASNKGMTWFKSKNNKGYYARYYNIPRDSNNILSCSFSVYIWYNYLNADCASCYNTIPSFNWLIDWLFRSAQRAVFLIYSIRTYQVLRIYIE